MKDYLPNVYLGKIVLREINEYDYLDYYEIGKDKETTKYLSWGPFNNPSEAMWVIREIFAKRKEVGLPIGYAIEYDGKMIGIIDYHSYFMDTNTCEIGYILNRKYWGCGIMKMCLRAATEIGFMHLDLDKIIVGHTIENVASEKVIKFCGYKYEYQRLVNLKDVDHIANYYAMYKYEFERRLL